MIVSDLCHVVVDSVVFNAPLYLVVNVVLESLSDLFDFIFLVYIFHFLVTCCYCV